MGDFGNQAGVLVNMCRTGNWVGRSGGTVIYINL